ncbi:hypothetical protein EZ428_21715 [Pedobacter frigiditerrae]|uniref:Calcineurin-like phosphoesterase domain-containing protein n=1 Tax=Pedobacter frigiditerrae TaxID=2530452 RepID=A0A4R0MKX9_9SPHI|nr:metallophosphoesterase [Pedobacter frigiditerrae]TCC87319.1 hypothetical protein EZ428_21715 [Pedobacter frigiditerrae]
MKTFKPFGQYPNWQKKQLTFSKGLSLSLLMFLSLGCEKTAEMAAEESLFKVAAVSSTQAVAADETFYMAVIPDTQYYTDAGSGHNGTMQMFINQIDWIVDNKTALNIQYVAHLGDITNWGDRKNTDGTWYRDEWSKANTQITRLETANIPYGLAVGNHDQYCNGDAGSGATNDGYGSYFGKDRYYGIKSWYGNAYGSSNNNDNHYDRITVFGQKYLIMYIEYNQEGNQTQSDYPGCPAVPVYSPTIEASVTAWANTVIQANTDHKVIIVSHSVLNPHKTGVTLHDNQHRDLVGAGPDNLPGTFTKQGQKIYDLIAKPNTNVFMMLGGHVTGEGYRVENQNGHVVKAFVSDYQGRPNGGNGYMRILKFNKTASTIEIRTIQPLPGANGEELDADSKFTVNMYN